MQRVEEYIDTYTRRCSNVQNCGLYTPWLTPDHARAVAVIAREETIKEVCQRLEKHIFHRGDFIENFRKELEKGENYE